LRKKASHLFGELSLVYARVIVLYRRDQNQSDLSSGGAECIGMPSGGSRPRSKSRWDLRHNGVSILNSEKRAITVVMYDQLTGD